MSFFIAHLMHKSLGVRPSIVIAFLSAPFSLTNKQLNETTTKTDFAFSAFLQQETNDFLIVAVSAVMKRRPVIETNLSHVRSVGNEQFGNFLPRNQR
jgi:hypothetical protein